MTTMTQADSNGHGLGITYQEHLRDLTESYLRSVISEAGSVPLHRNVGSLVPFGELGIDSFGVLKIIKKLESNFGTLPKSLLFENFNVHDLADYFVTRHERALAAQFAEELLRSTSLGHVNGRVVEPIRVPQPVKLPSEAGAGSTAEEAAPTCITEKRAYADSQWRDLVRGLFDLYKTEGCVSRGTRKIAPNLFIGSARRGYFNYGRSGSIILVYGYTGPREYVQVLLEEMYRHCEARKLHLNVLADEVLPSIGTVTFSATPFGALQRIVNLKEFTLEGGPMRRLRYQVSRFGKSGLCKTEEYLCGSNQESDRMIVSIIDKWCAAKTMVNPLVHDVRREILAGRISSDHRLFLTYLDEVLQNVVLITAMAAKENGYLMDLEFYPPDMALGGLEFAIVKIVEVLAAEGCDVLSLGGTYGCKLEASANADAAIDKILDDLREQKIFNDEGNFQFKNKFRPENKPVFLCRPVGSGDPSTVLDIIMMIADPEKVQTSDDENHHVSKTHSESAPLVEQPAAVESSVAIRSVSAMPFVTEGRERAQILAEFGFNPLKIPAEHVHCDLKTDSWAQLKMPAIEARMSQLHARLQGRVSVDESVRSVFPFAHLLLTGSGQEAEHLFFKAFPNKGVVLENLLFPSTIFHQIDNGFHPRELPHPQVFHLQSQELFKGNMALDALRAQLNQEPDAIALVCIEVGNNAAGGGPVSTKHLRAVKALLSKRAIPLVLDCTRILENAQMLIEREGECTRKNIWTVARELFSIADAVIGSLTKDFCVTRGGIIAVQDDALFRKLQDLVEQEGSGIDLIDQRMVALSLQDRKQIETKVLSRIGEVYLIWQALKEYNVPLVEPAGGHCVVIDVKRIPEFRDFADPVASFLAWMYENTGIRAAAHSVGMQKGTVLNGLVRLAIPVGMSRGQIDDVTGRLIHAFVNMVNIPEIVMEGGASQLPAAIYADYKLVKYHKVREIVVEKTGRISPSEQVAAASHPASTLVSASSESQKSSFAGETDPEGKVSREGRPAEIVGNGKPHRIQDIAIVGMAGRYPKAKNPAELWDNLARCRDCIEQIPARRYEERLRHGDSARYRGGFIDDVDKFDSLFFNISPREAEMLDPQERLFLEVAWEAIEDAGYYPELLAQNGASARIGVFVGAVWAMYQMLGVEEKHAGNKIVPNSFLWGIANRVSYCFNFSGPSLTVDTACSSSLTAIYLACNAIYAGDCSAAIVGGVNLDLHQAKLDINQAGGALSRDGICRSFGKGANGYVAGEGVGALFLKPLDQAVRDNDHVYGVIKSAVVNHAGRSSGYTVPNPKAQGSLIASALERAGIAAQSIGYIEAHGTGTELGDPVEIAGLNQAFSAANVASQTCAIGSIKSNIGHLEAAAGIVGVSKVLLQMQHRQLAPSLHSAELNEFIDFQNSPFYVVQRLEDWNASEADGVRLPLRAGISSFGAGGSNAHIILENYEPQANAGGAAASAKDLIFPLSARSEEQLREAAVRLAQFLQRSDVKLEDAAYTLQNGRKSFDHRLAVIAGTKEELLEKLARFLEGKKSGDISSGHAKNAEGFNRLLNRREREEFVRILSQRRDSQKIAELWTEGLLADWCGLHTASSGKRISLPTYPFADKRHWAAKDAPTRPPGQFAAGMHPLVDTNESTFERQLFKKTFHDRDFFIYDHLVADIPTLPGVAYLELARKAGEIAAGRKVQKIKNIVWVSPIVVRNSTPKEVFVELKPADATVRFEVFSYDEKGSKVLHSQGTLLYTTSQEAVAESEYVDVEKVRARCAKVIDGNAAYPLFKSFGLHLGPSFQVLQEVYKNDAEILGTLKLPEFRQAELPGMVLHPSLVDGSLQAGMGANLGENVAEMFVPFSIREVEILHPLQASCFSYVTETVEDVRGKKENSRVLKSDVLILDQAGKVLVKIRESIGVPLREVHKKPAQEALGDFSRLYYSYAWEKAEPAVDGAARNHPRPMLLFDSGETLRDLYLERERADAGQVILVQPGESFQYVGEDPDKQTYKINPREKEDFAQLFAHLLERQCEIENICFAWPPAQVDLADEKCVKESLERGVYSFLFLCQAIIKQKLESKVQLLYLYSGAEGESRPHNEAVAAFVNTVHLEHPKLLCKTLEVRGKAVEQALDAISAEFQTGAQDGSVVRYEQQDRYIKKLAACALEGTEAPAPEGIAIRERGVFLITGGAGGLGLIFAEFLAKEFKARLVLTGRSELSPERALELEQIRKSGAEVVYLRADVSCYEDVSNLIKESKARFGEINGIIHSAGVLRDSLIRNKTAEEMSAVFAPKVYGTLYLDELTSHEQLDFFVTFSSLAALAGNAGQCDYSFANHFMDSFAAQRELRRANGTRFGKTLSINWSLWAGGGMKLDQQTELYFKRTLGIMPLSAATGLDAFVKALGSARSQIAVLEGVQEKVEVVWGLRKKLPAAPAPPSAGPTHASAATLASGGGSEALRAWLQSELSQMVMAFLKLDEGEMSTDKILLDLGFDSMGLTTFANAINDRYQLDITPVLFFDYPSVGEIAKYLSVERESDIRRFYPGAAGSKEASRSADAVQREVVTVGRETHQERPLRKGWDPTALDGAATAMVAGAGFSVERRFVDMPIAIVGMSGVMPQSDDLEEFWENLKNARDMVTVLPSDRWRWEDYYGDPLKEVNKSNSKWGGFMKEVDKFDPLFFGISPREAHTMDPQQRIFLQTVWKAIEDSGQKVSDLSGTKTGLFVGVATNDYVDVMNSLDIALDGYSASGNSHSVLANRVSFLLNLRGPSAPIDTACSSSLVALHRAIESIHTGSCDMAVVGGVQVMLSPAAYISFGMAGMLSGDGKCRTFDKRANGYVRGEGCGAILLKPLSAAEADRNHIYAVIKATAENHGGRVTTLTAPNAGAQSALLIEAYEKAHIDPATVGYIECHGTGTVLGDPVEIQALSKAFSALYKRHNKAPAQIPHCGLSSVKTNIGHLETAAGIAGLLKVLLAIKHKQIPANIHFEEINPYINLKGTPFYIADKLTAWEAVTGQDGSLLPRRAGVSSFGFGGANAHIVLEEYIPAQRPAPAAAQQPQLIVLSAKNEERLQAYQRSIWGYLEREEPALADLAYTLQVGRDEMPERLALVVSNTQELGQKLAQMAAGGERPQAIYRNRVRSRELADGAPAESLLRTLVEQHDLARLAEHWVSGAKIDWQLLYGSNLPRRISAPTYPFARERYWVADATGQSTPKRRSAEPNAAALLHPLVHQNVSTLQEQKFISRFSGEEFYLADHVIETRKILPGVVYLEMARAAGELSGSAEVRVIRDLTWERPFVAGTEEETVEISLTPVKNEVKFVVRTVGKEKPIVHCTGKLAYALQTTEPEVLDIAAIQARCSEQVVSGKDLYPLLSDSGLKLGRSFQIVEKIYATESESLAILHLPEHLKAEANQFWLHPSLMDGSLHTGLGLMKKTGMNLPLSIPYSIRELQILHPLKDLYYGYATWAIDNPLANQNSLKVNFQLLDKSGRVLVRIEDYVSRPVQRSAPSVPAPRDGVHTLAAQGEAILRSFHPLWSSVEPKTGKIENPPESTSILLLGGNQTHLQWLQKSYPNSRHLQLGGNSSIDLMEKELAACSFDQLFWVAPDALDDADGEHNEPIIDQQQEGVLALFRAIKALLQAGYGNKPLQWTMVTSGTQRVLPNDRVHAAHASVAGLAGTLAGEYPHWDIRLFDVDLLAAVPAEECLSLPWVKKGDPLAHRRGQWFRQELAPMASLPEAGAPVYRQNGVYIVIGGAGGLGEVWSRFMMENYQANVVWIGRRAYDAAIEAKINASTRQGRAPLYISADATNLDALEQARKTILANYPTIHGVVHSAVVLRDRSLARMTEADFRAALSAKVDISVNLDRVFGVHELDFMLFFSSLISFFKAPGQANYAAGCAFKDSFAQNLQQQRAYPVKIINWGYWGSVGVVADEFHRKMMEQAGIGSIEPEEGMAALEALVRSDMRQMVLVKTLHGNAGLNAAESIMSSLAPNVVPRPALKAKDAAPTSIGSKTHSSASAVYQPDDRTAAYIQQIIIEKLSEALRLDAAIIRNDASFADYGVDSITGVSLVRAISETLAIELDGAKLFEYSTVDQLTQYIGSHWQQEIAGQIVPIHSVSQTRTSTTKQVPAMLALSLSSRFAGGDEGEVSEVPDAGANHAADSIAIIGMSGRFAESESLDEFWQHLKEGKDLVKQVTRWNRTDCVLGRANGHAYCAHGSFIDSIDRFDPSFFGISSLEAIYMDPQHRLFLEESWKALEDAGYGGESVREKQCGVYVGCGSSSYDRLFGKEPPPQAWWGNSQSVAPARIAYYLNLQGPAIAVDTACSSSLVAIHLACQALWSRETEMALAGGVYVQATAGFHQVANHAGMLSPSGKCYSFGAKANGFVPGEGVGVVVLKRLRDALHDGDHIYGVIAGSGINQNGRSNGLIAPNARAQERLERSVYDRFKINPETIQLVEAHGTATIVGDSIEYGAISRVFREYTDKKQFCAIGSVKTNVGHGATAAGVTSVLKVLLALKHRQIPSSLHFDQANPTIDFESGPFYLNTQLKEWSVEDKQVRRAAVSSFGFSGTNGHLVLEEAPSAERAALESPGYLVVLSARTAAQLKQQVQNLLALLKDVPNLSMNDLSFSLFVGRMHFNHRLSCLARNQEELVRLFDRWLETGTASQIFTSELREGKIREQVSLRKFGNYCIQECRNTTDVTNYLENLAAVAELYLQGYSLEFHSLFTRGSRRIPLPTYPFARERYWVKAADAGEPETEAATLAAAPPERRSGAAPPSRQSNSIPSNGADEELCNWLQSGLLQMAAELLKRDGGDLPVDKALLDLGFDSVGLTAFANAMNQRYQLDITPVLFFEYPSVGELARYLSQERKSEIRLSSTVATAPSGAASPSIAASQTAETTLVKAGVSTTPDRKTTAGTAAAAGFSAERRFVDMPIAIVGMSGVMPQSEDLEEFWENLKNAKDMVTVLPPDRWRWEDYYGDPLKEVNKSNSKWGGFMKEVDKFDPAFFGISPREADAMDPQQRIFLEMVWKAIEDSGQKVSDLSGTRTGLFVGAAANDYADVMNRLQIPLDGYSASGTSHSVLANRVSFLLNLRGPSAPIDTACSSSLVALHRAIESIHTGSCNMAVVGGVQVMLSPAAYIAFGAAGMLSGDGKCRTFDKRANGYVRGEGCGAILLKPLSAAEADGNHIYAVIKATAENHGGRVPTLTAPNVASQSALLIEAYEKAHIDPATVGYIECHGTGTVLGDPVEIQALSKAFSALYKRHNKAPAQVPHCGLSSVKTNIGHLETAAGIAGLLKVLLAIKHKQIPANIHFEEINPYINLKGTPFYIADKLTAWEAATGQDGSLLPRRAGVSSFGFGGANAHIVLEEYIAAARPAAAQQPQLIVLSAKNEERLQAYQRSICGYLEREEPVLADLAYTLQVGRDEMPERLALVVSSTQELRQKLAQMAAGGERPQAIYRNRVRNRELADGAPAESLLRSLVEQRDLARLAEQWVSGAKINWQLLYGSNLPRRISAPTYPFARERYWVGAEAKTIEEAKPSHSQPESKAGLQSFVPTWSSLRLETDKRNVLSPSPRILLFAGAPAQLGWVQKSYPSAVLLPLDAHAGIDIIENKLAQCSFDQLLWVAPDAQQDTGNENDERLIEQQEEGVLVVFRLIKALLRAGYANRPLQWTIVTSRTQRVIQNDRVHPAHAGIAGLAGTLAWEFPQWSLRLLDVDSLASVSLEECFSLPWDKRGNVLAHRRGQWFHQGLSPAASPGHSTPVYRQHGVYVVIGGAGGLGEVWSRFMMENYQATVVWIGRRAYDSAIEEKINASTRLGRAPLYISADATNLDSLHQASATIRATYPVIHGVVHSAVVLHDQTLVAMEEKDFRTGLSAKVDISINMDRVFGGQELDFMLFFSSSICFFKTPGQSNYAAGCTFKDSFAQKLQQQRAYPVKIINWGYWGSVGVASDEVHRKMMEQTGIGSIEPEEGMAFLEAFVSSEVRQMAAIKTLNSQATARLSLPVQGVGPVRAEATIASGERYVAPRTDVEKELVEISAQLLNLGPEKIGVNDSFFELGGHSLLATQLVSQIRNRFGIDLPLMALFQHTTVAQLAEVIAEADESSIPTIQPIDRSQFERFPLSFAQERVWFFDQLDPGSTRYNLLQAVVLHGELDIDRLEQAFNLVIARHESLRTLFPSHEGQPQQVILESLEFELERIDLSECQPRRARDSKARQLCQADALKPFDLARGPLLRGKAIKLAEQEYVLMLNMHHIIGDGWSLGVLTRELRSTIEALSQGRQPELAPLPIQYVDYSVWQRNRLEEGGLLKQQLAYWQAKLAGVPESLDLATDYPRPRVRSFAGAVHSFVLEAQLCAQLKNLAEARGGTLFMILLAALKVLLYRYSGQADICLGTLIANRQYGETEGLIGMFVNTLALRSQVDGEDTFAAFLSQVKVTCLQAYENQDTPFEKVVDTLRLQRNPALNPIFQVMVILQNATMGALDRSSPRYPLEKDISEFDFTAGFAETPEGLTGSIKYSTALYKPQTIERMGKHFTALCQAIIAAPTARIRDLDYLGEAEKHQLLVGYNATRADYPRDKCIHELFAQRVASQPDRTAAVCEGRELSYQQLYHRSCDLALYLQSQGVKPDTVVALCVERSLDMAVAIMAIAQAGGAYLPLDPAYPDDKLAYMLEDSQADIVLTQEQFTDKINSLLIQETQLITPDKHWPEISNSAAALRADGIAVRQDVKPYHASYLIYTSGGTGKPKGVLVEHQALVNRIYWMQKCYPLGQDDVVLQKTPYHSDVSVWEFFWPIISGARIVVAGPGRHQDVQYLAGLMNKEKVTTLHFVPSMLDAFLESSTGECGSVKRIFCSGETLERRSVDRYKIKFPNASLHHLYGPPEAAPDVMAYDCSRLSHSFVPIGAPIDNTQVYILDPYHRPQPVGVAGELHIAGDSLARGYLNHPELTEKKFISNPFQPGTRMYKTGDLARWLDDGNIQYLGRDWQ